MGGADHRVGCCRLRLGIDLRGTINKPDDRDQAGRSRCISLANPARSRTRQSTAKAEINGASTSPASNGNRCQNGAYSKQRPGNRQANSSGQLGVERPGRGRHAYANGGLCSVSGIQSGAGTEPFVKIATSASSGTPPPLLSPAPSQGPDRRFAVDLAALDAGNIRVEGIEFQPALQATADLYQISAKGFGGATVWIRQDGKTWTTR